MKNKKLMIVTSLVVLLPAIAGLMLWDLLPEQIPSHWNFAGEVDGWMKKDSAVWGMPVFLMAIHWVCNIITRQDPGNQNQNKVLMKLTVWICPALSLLIGVAMYGSALGVKIAADRLVPVILGGLFAALGNYMPKCTHNHTIGIRIPWTLADEENWDKTHRLAGRLWLAGGILMMALGLFRRMEAALVILGIMTVIPMVYSWRLAKKKA